MQDPQREVLVPRVLTGVPLSALNGYPKRGVSHYISVDKLSTEDFEDGKVNEARLRYVPVTPMQYLFERVWVSAYISPANRFPPSPLLA